MSELFSGAKSIPTPQVVRAFFPSLQLQRDGNGREKALCPLHTEETPSFTIYQNGFKCFGCGTHGSNIDLLMAADVAHSAGEAAKLIAERFGINAEQKKPRKARSLTLAEYDAYVKLPLDCLVNTFRLEETPKGVVIPYRDESGAVVGVQIRHQLEKGNRKDARFSWQKGSKPYPYGAWAIPRWKERGTARILLCEGASDVQVCWFNQIPALGIPGASAFKAEWASLIHTFPEIAIIQEPGNAGEQFIKSIGAALKGASFQGQIKAVILPEKDPRDLWLKHGAKFKDELEAAIEAAAVIDLYPSIPLSYELISRIVDLLRRHVFFKDDRIPLLIAIWVLGTYVYDIFTYFGYLWLNSPVKRCGKSLLEDILSHLSFKATSRLSNATESVIFRYADTGRTLILDEVESLKSTDKEKFGLIMSVLNNGFQSSGKVPRSERDGEGKFIVVEYKAYCPKILAGISTIVDTIEDRSFKIPMVRKTAMERVERFSLRRQVKELESLRQGMNLWAETKRRDLETLYDGIENVEQLGSLDDRFQDICEPLLAIATYADAELVNGYQRIMPELISLLLELGGKREDEGGRKESIGQFISVVEELLNGEAEKFISSTELLNAVKEADELSWIDSPRKLAALLGKFDLVPGRKSGGKVRGYRVSKEWVEEVKKRYVQFFPHSEVSQVSQTRAQSGPDGIL